MSTSKQIDQIESLLPQTQCKQCEYDGCRPYADAIINKNENINKCLPGGVKTYHAISDILERPRFDVLTHELMNKEQSISKVEIDAKNCVGCTKCIQACPVDAIIGASRTMHHIISDICTGCNLCIPACPVDCIETIDASTLPAPAFLKERYQQRNDRLSYQHHKKTTSTHQLKHSSKIDASNFIQMAIAHAASIKGHTVEES